jgi:hypothetical protein
MPQGFVRGAWHRSSLRSNSGQWRTVCVAPLFAFLVLDRKWEAGVLKIHSGSCNPSVNECTGLSFFYEMLRFHLTIFFLFIRGSIIMSLYITLAMVNYQNLTAILSHKVFPYILSDFFHSLYQAQQKAFPRLYENLIYKFISI